MIALSQIFGGYPGKEILHNISATIPQGKITALIGPNGSGKTTLLGAITGKLPVLSGGILYQGKPPSAFSPKAFARLVAVLPQVRSVPALQARELVAHGRYPHLGFGRRLTPKDEALITQAMERTHTLSMASTPLSRLSGGERQRVYLAMTLAQDTEILLLDEPTTYLDIGQKYELMELISQCSAWGKTVVLVLHDLPLAFSYSHQVLLLEEGRITCQGTPDQVFSSGRLETAFSVSCRSLVIDQRPEYLFLPQPPEASPLSPCPESP